MGIRKPAGTLLEAYTFQKMAEKGDSKALKVYNFAGKMLGVGLTSAIHLINPSMVIFSGGVAGAGDLLLKPMMKELKTRCFSSHLKGIKFRMAKLGDNMGVVGAARLALQSLG